MHCFHLFSFISLSITSEHYTYSFPNVGAVPKALSPIGHKGAHAYAHGCFLQKKSTPLREHTPVSVALGKAPKALSVLKRGLPKRGNSSLRYRSFVEPLRERGHSYSRGDMVQRVDGRVTLEIRDLDRFTQAEEVQKMLDNVLKIGSSKMTILEPNRRELNLAVVVADAEKADWLEKLKRVKIGFTFCPIKMRLMVTRYHRYLGYGQISSGCKVED